MSSVSNYTFNNMSRIGYDSTDNTQQNIANTRFSGYVLSNFYNDTSMDTQIKFASEQPTILTNGLSGGYGINGSIIDDESILLKSEIERSYEKLGLMQRPFLTVPYLGRGSCDPVVESRLQQGEMVRDHKSISTISETPYIDYTSYPMMDSLKNKLTDPSYSVEEAAMDGWIRGGIASREMASDNEFSKNYRPNNNY